MKTLSPYQLHQEALEIASWANPTPRISHETLTKSLVGRGATMFDAGNQDAGVGNYSGSDGSTLPDLGPLATFSTWPSVASTILHKAESLSHFNPGSVEFDPVVWAEYLRKFSTMPFFLSFTSDTREASISSLSLDKAVNAVDDLIKSFVSADVFNSVVTSIKKIAQLAIENKGQTQKNNNQQQGVLSVRSSQLYIGTIRTVVTMEYKSGKGYEQINQNISIYRAFGVVDFDKCKRSAATLLAWDNQSVGDWENDTGSAPKPPNNSPAWGS